MNRISRSKLQISWIALVALVAGCDAASPPAFRLNMVEAVSRETSPEYQREIANVLGALFGTPDEPFALPVTGLDGAKLRMAAGPAWSDEKGTTVGLYRKHCVHCHGITGDGRGPTARFLNPYPRDYRLGVYKFKSTFNPAKPTDDDLHRVLVNGVPGTAMPSFALLPGSEVEALLEYVKYLSFRGQMETQLISYVYDELGEEEEEDENGNLVPIPAPFDPASDGDQREAVMDMLADVVAEWEAAGEQIVVPTEATIPADERSPEEILTAIEAGRELFYGKRANCATCHGPTALGDGQQDDQDSWNKSHKVFLVETARQAESIETREAQAGLDAAGQQLLSADRAVFAVWRKVADSLYKTRNAIPRNLRQGVYRGGRRRIDIFHRLYAGVAGTPMPASGPASPGAQGTLTEAEMWHIVDYVLSLPYEPPSQPLQALPVNVGEVL